MGLILTILAIGIFLFAGGNLIQLYLNGDSNGGDLSTALSSGTRYLYIMLLGLPAFMVLQVYASTLRECGKPLFHESQYHRRACQSYLQLPADLRKVWLSKMGCGRRRHCHRTLRYVEVCIVVSWTHRHKEKNSYIEGLYTTLKIPSDLVKKFFIKGAPLLFNETLWAAAMHAHPVLFHPGIKCGGSSETFL